MKCDANDPIAYFEGIPCQVFPDAIADAARTMGVTRAIEAAREAAKQGYLALAEAETIEGRLTK